MVEPVKQRFKDGFDREEIGDKAGDWIDRPFKPQFHPIGMPMQPAAAVLLNDIRQNMRRLETEGLRDPHDTAFMGCQ
jgi:hypothetical protein